MADEELVVLKSRVLAAAEKCGDAKRILKEVFPDVFAHDGPAEIESGSATVVAAAGGVPKGEHFFNVRIGDTMGVIARRNSGTKYHGHALYVSRAIAEKLDRVSLQYDGADWVIVLWPKKT